MLSPVTSCNLGDRLVIAQRIEVCHRSRCARKQRDRVWRGPAEVTLIAPTPIFNRWRACPGTISPWLDWRSPARHPRRAGCLGVPDHQVLIHNSLNRVFLGTKYGNCQSEMWNRPSSGPGSSSPVFEAAWSRTDNHSASRFQPPVSRWSTSMESGFSRICRDLRTCCSAE